MFADKRSITFHLRPDATVHDGKPVTADGVKWSLDIVQDLPPIDIATLTRGKGIKGASRRRNSAPAQPDHPAASLRSFLLRRLH
jgi:ABC-type transport system substrate-binding protein